MDIYVDRGEIVQPPIESVTLILTADEALNLKRLMGRHSRNSIKSLMENSYSDEVIEATDRLVGLIYDAMYDV